MVTQRRSTVFLSTVNLAYRVVALLGSFYRRAWFPAEPATCVAFVANKEAVGQVFTPSTSALLYHSTDAI